MTHPESTNRYDTPKHIEPVAFNIRPTRAKYESPTLEHLGDMTRIIGTPQAVCFGSLCP